MKHKSLYADLSLILVSLVWGAGFVASKESLTVAKPFYIMTIRFFSASILMSLVFHKKLKQISKQDFKNGFIVGLFLFLAFGSQTVGLQFTDAAKQGFLTATNVVIVPFLYWGISKKRPDIYSMASALLCLFGISLLTLENGFHGINIGDVLTLICAVFFAAHIVSVGYYTRKTDPITLTILQLSSAAVLSLITAVFFEPVPTDLTLSGSLALLYLGLFSTFIAFLVQNVAQKYTTSTHAAIILSTECVFGSILSFIFLKEKFTILMGFGSLIIFISVIISETKLNFLKKNKLTLNEETNSN